jgi:hypothetical protein
MQGFRSYGDKRQRGGSKTAQVRNESELNNLPPAARKERRRVFRALSDARSEGLTLAQAARRNGTSVEAIGFWAPGIVARDGSITQSDRLWRPMKAIDTVTQAVVPVEVRGSRVASRLSDYWMAVEHYLDTGDEAPLRSFEGVRIAGVELETEPDVIDYLALLGELSFESIYQDLAA